jgi:hypothetical protein
MAATHRAREILAWDDGGFNTTAHALQREGTIEAVALALVGGLALVTGSMERGSVLDQRFCERRSLDPGSRKVVSGGIYATHETFRRFSYGTRFMPRMHKPNKGFDASS